MSNKKLHKFNLANIFSVVKDSNENLLYNMNDNITFDFLDGSTDYYSLYTVKPKDTYHGIAHRFFGNRRLWWLIVKFNNIPNIEVLDFPKPGTILKIPSVEVVNAIVKSLNSKN